MPLRMRLRWPSTAAGWSSRRGSGQPGRFGAADVESAHHDATADHTRWGNRFHVAEASKATPRCVVDDLKRARAAFAKRILSNFEASEDDFGLRLIT
ncbi:MAG: hypothetical protein ABI286_02650 [Edaphobacter sp.]